MKFVLGVAIVTVALGSVAGFSAPSFAKDYVVQELDHGPYGNPDMFSPDFLHIQPGDSITFQATDKGHNAVSIKGDIPAGAKPFLMPTSKTVTCTFAVPGVYAYTCQPHTSFGMVGLIVVGRPVNLDKLSFEGLPKHARERFETLVAQAKKSAASL